MAQVKTEARNDMGQSMAAWKERGRGGATVNLDGTPSATGAAIDGDGLLPLGPGEWTEPLGLPLCVVCQNVSFPPLEIPASMRLTVCRRKRWSSWRRAWGGENQTLTWFSSTSEPCCYGVSGFQACREAVVLTDVKTAPRSSTLRKTLPRNSPYFFTRRLASRLS